MRQFWQRWTPVAIAVAITVLVLAGIALVRTGVMTELLQAQRGIHEGPEDPKATHSPSHASGPSEVTHMPSAAGPADSESGKPRGEGSKPAGTTSPRPVDPSRPPAAPGAPIGVGGGSVAAPGSFVMVPPWNVKDNNYFDNEQYLRDTLDLACGGPPCPSIKTVLAEPDSASGECDVLGWQPANGQQVDRGGTITFTLARPCPPLEGGATPSATPDAGTAQVEITPTPTATPLLTSTTTATSKPKAHPPINTATKTKPSTTTTTKPKPTTVAKTTNQKATGPTTKPSPDVPRQVIGRVSLV